MGAAENKDISQLVTDLAVVKAHLDNQDVTLSKQDQELDKIQSKIEDTKKSLEAAFERIAKEDDEEDKEFFKTVVTEYARIEDLTPLKEQIKEVGQKIDSLLYKIGGALFAIIMLFGGWLYYALQHTAPK